MKTQHGGGGGWECRKDVDKENEIIGSLCAATSSSDSHFNILLCLQTGVI